VTNFQAGIFVVLRVLRGEPNGDHGVTALPFFRNLTIAALRSPRLCAKPELLAEVPAPVISALPR